MKHKILEVVHLGTDKKTGAVAKEISTTAGNFYSKSCAYNQTILDREKISYVNASVKFNGSPLYIRSIKYLTRKHKKYENIKQLTESRKKETSCYKDQIGSLRKTLTRNPDKICMLNFPFSKRDWSNLDEEDIYTIINLQIGAGFHYITIPLFPNEDPQFNLKLINYAKENKKAEEREIVPCMHTNSLLAHFKELLSMILTRFDINCLLVSCRSLLKPKTNAMLSYLEENFPVSKLLIGVDVKDCSYSKKHRLSHHHLLRSFNFDITCREVSFPLIPLMEFKLAPLDKKRIYHNPTGAMFNEQEQEDWDGLSLTDYFVKNFPAECNLNYQNFLICLNFVLLNKTGEEEINAILDSDHTKFITNKIYLNAFWISRGKSLSEFEE